MLHFVTAWILLWGDACPGLPCPPEVPLRGACTEVLSLVQKVCCVAVKPAWLLCSPPVHPGLRGVACMAWCHHSRGPLPAPGGCAGVVARSLTLSCCPLPAKMVSWQLSEGRALMLDKAPPQLWFPTLQDGPGCGAAAAVQHADQPGQPPSPGSHAGGSQPGHHWRPGHFRLAQRAGGHQPPDRLPKPPANAGEHRHGRGGLRCLTGGGPPPPANVGVAEAA